MRRHRWIVSVGGFALLLLLACLSLTVKGTPLATEPFLEALSKSPNNPREFGRSYAPAEISLEPAADPLGWLATSIPSEGTESQPVIVVDNSVSYQTMEGFGATHETLASNLTHDHLSPKLRSEAIDAVYGQVRLTTGNVEVGVLEAPSNASDPWAEQRNDDQDPFHFNWQGFNFSGSDAAKQKLIDLAQPKGFDDYYLGLKASVRWANTWMKAIRTQDYDRYLDEVAEQIAAGMIHWRDAYGIAPKFVQLFNEPTSGNKELDPGSIQEEIDIIKRTGSRLKREGFSSPKFIVPGEETEERSLEVARAILADQDARQFVGAIAYHPYPYNSTYCVIPNILDTSGRGEPDPEKVAVRHELRDLGKKYGLPLWMTEVSHGGVPAISFEGLLGRAIHIHDELVYADASAYFGMANLDDNYPVHGNAHDPYSEEGSIAIADVYTKKVHITGMGYAIGHYARWIPRGAVRIEASSNDPLLLVSAFRDEANNRFVLVLINDEDQPTKVTLQLIGFARKGALRFTGEQSSAKGAWAPVVPLVYEDSSRMRFLLTARSVTTIAASL